MITNATPCFRHNYWSWWGASYFSDGFTTAADTYVAARSEQFIQAFRRGVRTTILVGLAACMSMIQANLLLSLEGKTSASFPVADVLRFPLGVLTGMGFIGGGTVLKRGSLVLGVTTAATLWLVTAIGLCFGGGQWIVGAAGTLLAVFTLWALKWLDMRIPREHRALLAIDAPKDWAAIPNEIDRMLRPRGYRAQFVGQGRPRGGADRLKFEVSWKQPDFAGYPAALAEADGGK